MTTQADVVGAIQTAIASNANALSVAQAYQAAQASAPVTAPSPVVAASSVLIANGPTDWFSTNSTLNASANWIKPGGDCIDANGVVNGPTPSISLAVTANTPTTIDISKLSGDLLLNGVRVQWANSLAPIQIDGAQADAFWIDVSTNHSLVTGANYPGEPVLVRNPTSGKTLTITTATSGTLTINRVAGTPIVDYPMVGPSNIPDIMELDLTDQATLFAAIPSGDMAQPYAYNPEYLVDPSGMNYIRFTDDPALLNPRLISWFYLFPLAKRGQLTAHCRYCLYIEPDMPAAFNEAGMKLPGLTNGYDARLTGQTEDISLRMEHSPPAPNNNGLTALLTYSYSASSPSGGYGVVSPIGPLLRLSRWYVIEQRAVMNTPAVADGEFTVWVNGNQVLRQTNVMYRNLAASTFNMVHVNVYHGGTKAPKGIMHYRVARVAAATSYIGVPKELVQ